MTHIGLVTNYAIIIIICDVQLLFPYAQHLCFLILIVETLSLETCSSLTQTVGFCMLPIPWLTPPKTECEYMTQIQILIMFHSSADSDWSENGNMTQAIAIRVSPMILLSKANRKRSFSSPIKEHHECDDCRPSGDLVLYAIKTLERVTQTPGRSSRDSFVEGWVPCPQGFQLLQLLC